MDISNWIERWAGFAPDKTAIRFEGRDITYRALRDRVRGIARMMRTRLGVGKGDRVAFLGFNSPDFLAQIFACGRLGAILVPLNWRLAAPELLYILQDSGVSAVFVESEFLETIDGLRADLAGCRFVALTGATDRWEDFEGLVAAPGADRGSADDPRPEGGADDPVLIVYTSGTTGRPKGAVLTQAALTFNAINAIAAHDMTSEDVVLTTLPMFHVGGMNIQTTPALHCGATVILHRRFDVDALIAAIRDERPSLSVLVPAVMKAVMDHPAWPETDFSCLRCIDTGSTTVPRPLLDAYLARGIPVIQIYGLTETAPVVIHQRIPQAWTHAGSVGKPALHCDAKIVDPQGKPVAPGERGEIVVRGPNIMTGYWNDPAATNEAFRDGWFRTGDVGHTDDDGNFHVDDRMNDVIISGGENIYPAEVERVLDECPWIAEAAVVARPDDRWGEAPVAVVVLGPGCAASEADVLALFPGRLARFKHPRDVCFLDALPRNVMGKILKFALREIVVTGRAP